RGVHSRRASAFLPCCEAFECKPFKQRHQPAVNIGGVTDPELTVFDLGGIAAEVAGPLDMCDSLDDFAHKFFTCRRDGEVVAGAVEEPEAEPGFETMNASGNDRRVNAKHSRRLVEAARLYRESNKLLGPEGYIDGPVRAHGLPLPEIERRACFVCTQNKPMLSSNGRDRANCSLFEFGVA